jgi:type IV secretion system protein VirB9
MPSPRPSRAVRAAALTLAAIAAAAAVIAPGVPALADTTPVSLPVDPRIRQFVYDENTVYRLDVHMRFITSIQFAPGEIVESIQIGDSASWQILRLDRGDVVSVKPLIERAHTNMTVMTDRRVYTFELRALRPTATAALNFRVGFTYPADDLMEFSGGAGSGAGQAGLLFHNYLVAGDAPFQPVEVFDDTRQTTFRFAPNTPRPAIFKVDETGAESIVNLRQAGDRVIVDGVSDRWTVRIGDEELCIASARAAPIRRSWSTADGAAAGSSADDR